MKSCKIAPGALKRLLYQRFKLFRLLGKNHIRYELVFLKQSCNSYVIWSV